MLRCQQYMHTPVDPWKNTHLNRSRTPAEGVLHMFKHILTQTDAHSPWKNSVYYDCCITTLVFLPWTTPLLLLLRCWEPQQGSAPFNIGVFLFSDYTQKGSSVCWQESEIVLPTDGQQMVRDTVQFCTDALVSFVQPQLILGRSAIHITRCWWISYTGKRAINLSRGCYCLMKRWHGEAHTDNCY